MSRPHPRPDVIHRAAQAIRRAPKRLRAGKIPFNQSHWSSDVSAYIAACATISDDEEVSHKKRMGQSTNIEDYREYTEIAEEILGRPLGYLVACKWPCSVFTEQKRANLYMAHQPTATEAAEVLERIARAHVASCAECTAAFPDLVPSYLKE